MWTYKLLGFAILLLAVDVKGSDDVPEPPTNLNWTKAKTANNEDGLRKWKYTLTWKAPTTQVDKHVVTTGGGQTQEVQDTIVVLSIPAGSSLNVSVKVTNNKGKESVTSLFGTIVAAEAAPSKPLNVRLQSETSDCVSLTWSSPQYPNGKVKSYQYDCDSTGWMTTNNHGTQLVCGYKAFTAVTCTVRALTVEVGDVSDSKTSTTLCSAPDPPTNLKWTKSKIANDENGLRKWKYNITWQAPTTINCREVENYEVTTGRGPTQEVKDTTLMLSMNAGSSLNVSIKVINNGGHESTASLSGTIVSAEAAPSEPLNVHLQSDSLGCVLLKWDPPQFPNGQILSYQRRCSGDSQWISTVDATIRRAKICKYNPKVKVECLLRADNSAVNPGDAATVSTTILCPFPEIRVSLSTSTGVTETTATVNATIEVVMNPYCVSDPTHILVAIYDSKGDLVAVERRNKEGVVGFTNLYGYTNYSVIVGINNSTETVQNIVTPETVPGAGPELEVDFTSSCVNLQINPPDQPNGILDHYQYWCASTSEALKGKTPISAQKIANGEFPSVCNLPQATQISCEVFAVNGAGDSPTSNVIGYTKALVSASDDVTVLPPVDEKPNAIAINFSRVQLHDQRQIIQSYLILLDKMTTKTRRSALCSNDDDRCSTIAKIRSQLVGSEGYVFYVGDGKQYGGYVNSALVPKSSYAVQIAISVYLPEYNTTIYQEMNEAITLTAPSEYCDPLPSIDNAISGNKTNHKIGESVVYGCDDGYQKTGGDAIRICALAANYTSFWTGSSLHCEESKESDEIQRLRNIGIGTGVAGAVLLVAAVAMIIVIIRRRKAAVRRRERGKNNTYSYQHDINSPNLLPTLRVPNISLQ